MIAIIDYKAGNAPSVLSAIRHIGFGADAKLINSLNVSELEKASRIILPGVGSAGATMQSLRESGFIESLNRFVREKGVLFLGICVGMQILFDYSEEENADCLGWLSGRVLKFDNTKVKVPQIGWNKTRFIKDTLMSKTGEEDYYYFVNSYHVLPEDKDIIMSLTEYDGDFASSVNYKNIFGAQFHVEKSGEAGLELLKRFLEQIKDGLF